MTCPLCTSEIPDYSRFCRFCGKAVAEPASKGKNPLWVLLLIGLIVVIGLACIAYLNRVPDHIAKEARAAREMSERAGRAARTGSAAEIISAYQENEIKADSMYKGYRATITGRVSSIGKDILGTPYLTLTSDGEIALPSIQCMFPRSAERSLEWIIKGQLITLSGEGQGKMMNILFGDCEIVR